MSSNQFKTTISLFQKKHDLVFKQQKISGRRYKAEFVLDKIPESIVVLSGVLIEKYQNVVFKNGPCCILNKGFGVFSEFDISLKNLSCPSKTNSLLFLKYSEQNRDLEPESKKDFRHWPEELIHSLWNQELFQKQQIANSLNNTNRYFVSILETLDWPTKNGCIDCVRLQKGENSKIFKVLLETIDKERHFTTFCQDTTSRTWWNINSNCCIPTDVPVKKLASFCLATGRFPNLKEVNMLRLEGNQPHKER